MISGSAVSNRAAVNVAAVAEGAALVIYAAYNHILISRTNYGLTATEYGWVFAPELITLIAPAVLAVRIGRRWPTKRVYAAGLTCSLVSMILLSGSAIVGMRLDYPLLLVSSPFLGAGFGLAMPALFRYAQALSPAHAERSALVVNALLAAGVAIPPLLTVGETAGPLWPGSAVVLALLFAWLLAASHRLPDTSAADAAMQPRQPRMPVRVKLYGLLVILYALSAIMCVTWSQARAAKAGHSSLSFTALEFGAFWAALVMLARVLFTVLDERPSWRFSSLALFGLAAAVAGFGLLAQVYPVARLGIYVLAALACAALVPLRHRAGEEDLTIFSAAFASGIALLYPLGLGLARASLTTMLHTGLSLLMIFGIAGAIGVAAGLFLLTVLQTRSHIPPASARLCPTSPSPFRHAP
jgi:MFS family permease